MEKNDYLDILKNQDLRPNRIKLKEHPPTVLTEVPQFDEEVLKEIFIQANEIESMKSGKEKDKQILRLAIIAELDASNLYEKLAELTSDKSIKKVLLDISKEEKTHVGEFQYLLQHIDTEYEEELESGAKEVEDIINKKE